MIENKLLHYETRAAFELDKPNIANTSIAFIDEGRTIYTWGKEYNTSQVSQEVELVQELVEQIEHDWEEELNAKVEKLNALVLQKHADAVARAREDILNARTSIQLVANDLNSLTLSCSTKSEVLTLLGQITAITNWYNLLEQSLAKLSSTLDAVNAKIVTEGTYTNIVNNAITQYDHEVDIKIGKAKEEMTYTNVNKLTDTVVGRLMDAENGVLKDYATLVKLGEEIDGVKADVSSQVTSELNALDPSWNTLVSRVATVEGTALTLSTQYTSLSATVSGFSAITTRVQDHETRIAQIESNVDDDESKVTLAAVYKVVNEDVNKTIAAKIFALANAQGSNITLSADKINLSGDTTVLGNFVASKISAADITAKALNIRNNSTGNSITADATNGLKFTDGTNGRSTFTVNMNGSGSIGYRTVTEEVNGETVTTYEPAIAWDLNGNVQINSALIGGGGSEQTGPTYVQNPYNDQWIHDWKDTIDTWKGQITSWKALLESNNNSRAYLTAAGIVFDNSAVLDPVTNSGSIVAVTSVSTQNGTVPAGVSHTAVGGDLNGEHGYYLKNDGTGELAFGSIKWDKDGNLTVKNLTVEGNTFQSEKGHKTLVIENIHEAWDGSYINYSILSSGVVIKRDKLLLYSKNEIELIYNNYPLNTVFGIDYAWDKAPLVGYLIYKATGSVTDGTWNSFTSTLGSYFNPIYKYEPMVLRVVYNGWKDGTMYNEYGANVKFYKHTTASRLMTFLAQRSFEYPVFDSNYNVISSTKFMPNGVADNANPNYDIGVSPDDSRDPNGTYWTYESTDPTKLNSEPIEIDRRYRNFVDVHWKEIFSVLDDNLSEYPDGRRWIIEDGEEMEVMCVDTYQKGPFKTPTSNGIAIDYNAGVYTYFDTLEQREEFIADAVENKYNLLSPPELYTASPSLYSLPFVGSTHIKFKRNPYEFYLNLEQGPVFLHRNTDLSELPYDYFSYRAWSIAVDESRFGWETW